MLLGEHSCFAKSYFLDTFKLLSKIDGYSITEIFVKTKASESYTVTKWLNNSRLRVSGCIFAKFRFFWITDNCCYQRKYINPVNFSLTFAKASEKIILWISKPSEKFTD